MQFLDNFTHLNSLKADIKANDAYNGFTRLLNYYQKDIDTAQYMSLYYFHLKSEKCLNALRKKDLHAAELYYQDLNAIDRTTFPSCTANAVEADYAACDAYYDYVKQNYPEAKRKIQQAIDYTIAQASDMETYISSVYELHLNFFRIHAKERDIQGMISVLSRVLGVLLFDVMPQDLAETKISKLDEREKTAYLHHILNHSILQISEKGNFSLPEQSAIYLGIIDLILAETASMSAENASWSSFLILAQRLKGNDDSFLNELNNHFTSLSYIPFYLKRLLVNQYLELQHERCIDVSAHPAFENFQAVLKELNVTYKPLVLAH